jgi:predicted ATPase
MGKLESAQVQFEQGYTYYDSQQHRSYIHLIDEDQGVICLSYTAWNSWILGYPDRASNSSHKALTLARNLSHPLSLVFALSYAAIHYQCRQEPREAQKLTEAAIALATEQGFVFWTAFAEMFLGWALFAQGQKEEGIELIRRSYAAWQATGAKLGGTHFRMLLAETYGKIENADAGLNVVAEALNVAKTSEECVWEAELYRVRGELLMMKGESVIEVEKNFKHALSIGKRQSAKSFELRSALSLSQLWQAQGKREDARRMLAKIYGWFTEGFDTPDLKAAKALLHELS